MPVCVITADQVDSRSRSDRVDPLLPRLARFRLARPFERTAGDEVQGVLTDPEAIADVSEELLRSGDWHIGVGFGDVDQPLPASARAGRGPAYLHAREAVTAAKTSPGRLRVIGNPHDPLPRRLETVLWLWAAVLDRRTTKGWEVADLVAGGLTYEEAGRRLGITQSAVSQRAASAGLAESRRARELTIELAADILRAEVPSHE